jgi:hypothetical protein
MRSVTMKAALAAMIIAVPLSGAFASNGNGGTGGGSPGSRGSSANGDFAQKRWFDGIDSFHQYPTPLGVRHYGSPYSRSDNRPNTESTPMDPIGEGFKAFLDLGH